MTDKIVDLLDSFVIALRAEGRRPRTIAVYSESVRQYVTWLEVRGRVGTLEEFDRRQVRDWLAQLRETRAPNTVRTRHISLARFASWLREEGEIEVSPLDGLAMPSADQRPVPLLTDDELAAVLRRCSGASFTARRNEAIVRLLLDTGIRAAELIGLTVDAVDLTGQSAAVIGKGGKRRTVHFGAKTTRALDRYLRLRRAHAFADSPRLLLSSFGNITSDGLRHVLERLGESAGVSGRLHPHRLRHTFAHDWLAAGGAEHDLMRLAGWASPAMLGRYGASGADARARDASHRMARGDRV